VPKRAPRRREAEPAAPRRFRVIDALSREVVADDADLTATVQALRGLAQAVDASVYVWEPKACEWRLLTRRELSLLWERR
jgi:hypothetical protein